MWAHTAGYGLVYSRGHLTDAKHRIAAVEDTTASTIQTLADLQQKVEVLMAHSEDAENRLRRNNVWVVGLPEGVEGPNPAVFAEAFFKQLLGLQQLSPMSHAILVRLLDFRDRDQILAEARKHPELRHENAVIILYPDLQKKRRSFTDVHRHLREKGLIYNMLYPSRLKVVHHSSAKFFESEVADWLDSIA